MRIYKGIALLPLAAVLSYNIRFALFGVSLNVLDILLVASVGVLFVWHRQGIHRYYRRERLFLSLIAIFIFSSTIPLLGGETFSTDIAGQWKSVVVLPVLYGVGLSFSLSRNILRASDVATAALFGGLVILSLSLGAALTGNYTYDGRLAFPYQSANQLAMALAPLAVGGAAWVLASRNNCSVRAFFVLTAAVIAVIMTKSLGALAALVAGSAVIGWFVSKGEYRANSRLFPFSAFVVVGFFVLAAVAVFIGVHGSFDEMVVERTSFRARLEIWRSAFHLLGESWKTGIGFGGFQDRYLDLQPHYPLYQEWAVSHPHSLALAIFLGAGIGGLLSFFGVCWLAFRSFRYSTYSFVASAALVVVLVHGFVDTTVFRNDLAVFFWSTVAVLYSRDVLLK